jgi:WD40 repeat protein
LVDEQECTLRGHSNKVTSVAYSPDGKHIVSGSFDSTVKIWDAQSGKEVRVVI